MRNNVTAFSHPEVIRKIRGALWIARIEAKKTGREGRQYIANRKGNNFLRVSAYADGSFRIWGDQSREVTPLILAAVVRSSGRA